MMPRVEELIFACLRRAQAQRPLGKILVGFSGGADSAALVAGVAQVAAAHFSGLEVQALHVNHGLQDEADAWQQHCQAVCGQLQVRFASASVTVPAAGNVEANARRLRYQAFRDHIDSATLLLLGHHAHDQTETLLYRLFQGRGLLPMRAAGDIGPGRFARPLLAISPDELKHYLAARDIAWIEDASNQDVRFTRNYLRAEIVPLLSRRWQQLHDALARVAGAHAAVQTALEFEVAQLPDRVALTRLPAGAARLAWLRAYLHSRSVFSIADKALRAFDEQLQQADSGQLQCGAAGNLYLYDGHLYFVAAAADAPPDATLPQHICVGEQCELPGGTLALLPAEPGQTGAFRCAQALRIGFRQGGERISQAGWRKSVKQVFSEARVPPWQRDGYPLLYCADELVCVPGLAVVPPAAQTSSESAGQWCRARWQPRQ
jgi:tRNA(Ile)-lysidine synthase